MKCGEQEYFCVCSFRAPFIRGHKSAITNQSALFDFEAVPKFRLVFHNWRPILYKAKICGKPKGSGSGSGMRGVQNSKLLSYRGSARKYP